MVEVGMRCEVTSGNLGLALLLSVRSKIECFDITSCVATNSTVLDYPSMRFAKTLKKYLWTLFTDGFQPSQSYRGDSLGFTIHFPGVPGIQMIDFGRMKD